MREEEEMEPDRIDGHRKQSRSRREDSHPRLTNADSSGKMSLFRDRFLFAT